MELRAIGQSFQQLIPSQEQVVRKFSTSLPEIANNLTKIALPAIMLYAACNVPGAEAGILGFFAGYIGTTVVGGAMIVVGAITAPVGGAALIAPGVAAVTAAPYVGAVTGGFTGPV